jgi:hypothetical protein
VVHESHHLRDRQATHGDAIVIAGRVVLALSRVVRNEITLGRCAGRCCCACISFCDAVRRRSCLDRSYTLHNVAVTVLKVCERMWMT